MHRLLLLALTIFALPRVAPADPDPLTLRWEKNYLTISGDHLPGK